MSISETAKQKALEYIKRVYKIANPDANLESGSSIKSVLLLPFAMVYSAIFEEKEQLKNMHLGNYSEISRQDMDNIAFNMLEERPRGSRATTTLKVYLDEIESFKLDPFPYFLSNNGNYYKPVSEMSFGVSNILEDDGQMYVNVPVIAESFGPDGQAPANSINEYRNMPIEVTGVTNPEATIGGDPRMNNTSFYRYLKNSQNDGTLAQPNGIRQYILDEYPEVSEIRVIDSGHDKMIRDEVWKDGDDINLFKSGEPYAEHEDIGEIDFDRNFRRVHGDFSKDMEGERIAIEDDPEKFRDILRVNDGEAIISGAPLYGQRQSKVWGRGPQVGGKSDIYTFFPFLEVQSTIVEKKETTRLSGHQDNQRFYYDADEINYNKGVVVYQEGTTREEVFDISKVGQDDHGHYIETEFPHGVTVSQGDVISVYDMSEIEISPEGDVSNLPAMYIMRVDELNPFTLETENRIPHTQPGNFHSPGWRIENDTPSRVFSAKENKKIVLDEKDGLSAFEGMLSQDLYPISENKLMTQFDNIFDYTGGREIEVEVFRTVLQRGRMEMMEVASATEDEVVLQNDFIEYINDVGYRDDFFIEFYDSSQNLIEDYWDNTVRVSGDSITTVSSNRTFPTNAVYVTISLPYVQGIGGLQSRHDINNPKNNTVFYEGDGDYWVYRDDVSNWVDLGNHNLTEKMIPEESFESVILHVENDNVIEIAHPEEFRFIITEGGEPKETGNVSVFMPDETGDFTSNPIRITYTTNSAVSNIQDEVDDNENRLLCDDTLIRSFLPSVIDATISFSGNASSEEVHSRFIDLIQEVIEESGDQIKIDVSNIVSSISTEGLVDTMDLNFEVKVTNYLQDGEHEVRYYNPSSSTKRKMSVYEETESGMDRIKIRNVEGEDGQIQGRGKLILGGNNPDTQEIIPYESVIEEGDYYKFLFRQNWYLDYDHHKWETAYVTSRDYDPELEFTDGAIFIPSENRPYVRELIVLKES